MAGAGGNSTAEAIELSRYRAQGRRRLHAFGRAVLQPAVAGRHLPPLPARSPRRSTFRWSLYNVPGRTVADMLPGDRAAPGAGAGHRRHQGGERRHRRRACCADPARRRRASRSIPATTAPPIALMLLGGHGNGQRHRQRRAAGDAGALHRRPRRQRARSGAPAAAADAAASRPVRRAEPGADQMGAGAAGPLRLRQSACRSCRSATAGQAAVLAAMREAGLS